MRSRLLVFLGLALLAAFAAISIACALPSAATSEAQSSFPVLQVSIILAAEAFIAVAIKLTLGKRQN